MTIIIDNHEFEVEGEHQKYYPETRETPEEGGYFEIEKIWFKGLEISEMLNDLAPALVERIQEKANDY